MEKDTVSMHFVCAAVARLAPASRSRALAHAGIPEALLQAAHARVPAQAFSALWLAVSRELDDEFFGLDRRRMKVGSFALLCHAVLGHLACSWTTCELMSPFMSRTPSSGSTTESASRMHAGSPMRRSSSWCMG